MAKDNKTIIKDVLNYINRHGGNPGGWYAGIASDPKRRLDEHGVEGSWIYREATSAEAARLIETYLVERVGLAGGSGGGDASSQFVYAYKKTPHTSP